MECKTDKNGKLRSIVLQEWCAVYAVYYWSTRVCVSHGVHTTSPAQSRNGISVHRNRLPNASYGARRHESRRCLFNFWYLFHRSWSEATRSAAPASASSSTAPATSSVPYFPWVFGCRAAGTWSAWSPAWPKTRPMHTATFNANNCVPVCYSFVRWDGRESQVTSCHLCECAQSPYATIFARYILAI
jgi:hypothetical protein